MCGNTSGEIQAISLTALNSGLFKSAPRSAPLQRGRCSVGIQSIAICQSLHTTDFLQSDPPPTTGRASERASDSCGHGHSIKLMLTAVIHFVTPAGTEATAAVAPSPAIRVRPSSMRHTACSGWSCSLLTWHDLFPLLRLQEPISASDVKENRVVPGINVRAQRAPFEIAPSASNDGHV